MINVVCFGYRPWAIRIFETLKKHPKVNCLDIIGSKKEYDTKKWMVSKEIDVLLFIGWSWIIPSNITNTYLCLGIHPSDLPNFRGGAPLQHQIINGIIKSKVSLITLSEKLDGGNIWLKEQLDLSGDNMQIIFNHLVESTSKMLIKFFDVYPNIRPEKQKIKEGSYFPRRKPEDSKLDFSEIKNMSLKQIYNFIRALTDPYPNAYFEDEKGNKLIFKSVEFIEKESI